VIVNLHWGAEFQHAPSSEQLALARRLTRSPDVTAIVGQHAHVVQPIRRVNGKIVVFGEGNLVSNQSGASCPTESQDGLIAFLRLVVDERRARVIRVRYLPMWVRPPDYAVLPAPPDSFARTVAVVGRPIRAGSAPPIDLRCVGRMRAARLRRPVCGCAVGAAGWSGGWLRGALARLRRGARRGGSFMRLSFSGLWTQKDERVGPWRAPRSVRGPFVQKITTAPEGARCLLSRPAPPSGGAAPPPATSGAAPRSTR
jgi:hypothetical protein